MSRPAPVRRGGRLGLRREALLVLPFAAVLLAALAAWAAFAQRASLEAWIAERQARAETETRRMATLLASGLAFEDLRRQAGGATGWALLDGRGAIVATLGEPVRPPAPTALASGAESGALEPEDRRLLAWARTGDRTLVAVWPAALLDGQLQGQRQAFRWIVALSVATVLLIGLFLRRLLRPYEQLLERARDAGLLSAAEPIEDEVAALLGAFESALARARSEVRSEVPAFSDGPAAEGSEERALSDLRRSLLPALDAGLVLLDTRGKVLAGNADAWRLLGAADRAPARALLEATEALAEVPELRDWLRGVATGPPRSPLEIEAPPLGRDRGVSGPPLALHLLPLRPRADAGATGREPRGYALLVADRTERRRREEERRLAENLHRLGETAAGLAHELRNGLAAARGYLGLLERRATLELDREDLAEIRRELDALLRVVRDFLDFARPGTARPARTSPRALAEQVLAEPEGPAGDGMGGIRLAVEDGLPDLLVDPYLVKRALSNLVRNALAAQPEPREPVNLDVVRDGPGVAFAIADRGPGLDPAIEERLFEPFHSGRSGGVGLGLAVSRRIALLHGGRLSLANRPGGGAVARLWLPAEGAEDDAEPRPLRGGADATDLPVSSGATRPMSS